MLYKYLTCKGWEHSNCMHDFNRARDALVVPLASPEMR